MSLTAATGMDALTHAIEGYITGGAWELSDMFHLKAIEIIARSLRSAVKGEAAGIEGMALGQYVAGMGFSNVGLGIVHFMAHPLGAVYDTPHGVANAIVLSIKSSCRRLRMMLPTARAFVSYLAAKRAFRRAISASFSARAVSFSAITASFSASAASARSIRITCPRRMRFASSTPSK